MMDTKVRREHCDTSTLAIQNRLKDLEQRYKEKKAAEHNSSQNQLENESQEISQRMLTDISCSGKNDVKPLSPGNEYPTLLTRIPIFLPTKRTNQKNLLDSELSLNFSTSWGRGKKYGPPLTIYDEDTLIALGKLRENRMLRDARQLPIPISSISQNANRTLVHSACCLVSEVQAQAGTTTGGAANQKRLESIRRLSATRIELFTSPDTEDRYQGRTVGLIDVAWDMYDKDGVLYIQFTPEMARWYENEYTYIDFETRKQLTDAGKAIHRFLSSQPKNYRISTEKVMKTILYQRPYKEFMRDLRATIETLKKRKWLNNKSTIEGTGRSKAHMLIIDR